MAHQRTLQSFMMNPNLGDMTVKRDMVNKFEDIVYAGTVPVELLHAVVYCQDIVGILGMEPLGITCPKASARDIHVLFQRSPMPKQMAFSGTIWMLDLDHRVQPLDKMGCLRGRGGHWSRWSRNRV